jgi:hypothetical protein
VDLFPGGHSEHLIVVMASIFDPCENASPPSDLTITG